MAYHEAFWATTATVASAILVAVAVSLGQSIDTMVERIREHRLRNEPVGSRRWNDARRRMLLRSYLYALASITLTTFALFASLVCLLNDDDLLPAWIVAVALFAGILLIFFQVFAAADAKLAEVRSHPAADADGDADLS